MKRISWRWLCFPLCAFVVATLLHSDALLRHFHEDPEKVALFISGPRTDIGDNYYYFTLLRHAPERWLHETARRPDADGGNHRNVNAVSDAYAAALYAGNALYWVANTLAATSRDTVLLTSILHTTVLGLSFTAFMAALLGGDLRARWFPVLVLSFVGLVFVDAFANSLYFHKYFYWEDDLLTFRSNPTRLVNPTLFWAVGLGAAALIARWIREDRIADLIGASTLSGLTGLFSISVGATLVLALGLAIAFDLIARRVIRWKLVGIAVAAILGLLWGYLQLRAYASSSLGQELRHGEFLGLRPKWHFLWLLGLIPFAWRSLGAEGVFVAALVMAAAVVGMFCESFNLGSRLWLRGAVIYAWAVLVFLAARGVLRLLASSKRSIRGRIWIQGLTVILMGVFVFKAQKPNVDSWKGFVEGDKWKVLEWIDTRLPVGAVVASADIEDAFLLPIYTHAKPLYAMYGLTNRTRDDELRRYFYDMRLFDRDTTALDAILSVKQTDINVYHGNVMGSVPVPSKGDAADAAMFLELVLYQTYVRGLSNALADPVQHHQLEELLKARFREASVLNYSFEYAIVENDHPRPARLMGYPVVYTKGRYSILKNPSIREPPT